MHNILTEKTNINSIRIEEIQYLFKKRKIDSHKGEHGTVAIIGGHRGMEGSVLLAARAALKIGSGKILVGFVQNKIPLYVDYLQPELMLQTSKNILKHYNNIVNTWVVGCGMGQSYLSKSILKNAFNIIKNKPVVIDADALNIISSDASFNDCFNNYNNTLIMTPHPKEASRILKCETADIQSDRPNAAKKISTKYNAWTILKGYKTIISSPSGDLVMNNTGNPGLASAGTGDVLAGIIGSLIGQGIDIKHAIYGGVWLHGISSEYLTKQNNGPIGMTANEIIDVARKIRNMGYKSSYF